VPRFRRRLHDDESVSGKRELMVVGHDEKVGISDAGAYVFSG
jgi:hypothetical protein